MNLCYSMAGHVLLMVISAILMRNPLLANSQATYPYTSPLVNGTQKPYAGNVSTGSPQFNDTQNLTTSTSSQSSWFTYYSSASYNTYSCWKDLTPYVGTISYWTGTNWPYLATNTYYSYYYNDTQYTSSLVTLSYTAYTEMKVYNKMISGSLSNLPSNCDTIGKWYTTQYKCPYSYSSFGSLCLKQDVFTGKEFWRPSYTNSTAGSCKYSPQLSYQCNTFYGPVGTWNTYGGYNQTNQWSVYSASVSTCSFLTMYNQSSCYFNQQYASNVYEPNVTCSMYSAQYNSFCLPQDVYTSVTNVSSGQMSYFYTSGSTCFSDYQPYYSCYSCGYSANYFYAYLYNTSNGTVYPYYGYTSSYNLSCSNFYSGNVLVSNMHKDQTTFTYSYGPYTSTVVSYGDNNTSMYNWYYANSAVLSYREIGDYNCYATQSSYTWRGYNSGTTYGMMNLYPYVLCDPYRYTRIDFPYISCDASMSLVSSCKIYTGYVSTSYGLITFSQYQTNDSCNTSWTQNQTCYGCQGTNNSCIPRQTTSFAYYSYSCNTYSANYLSCTQMGISGSIPSPSPSYNYSGNASYLSPNGSWERSWMCREGGKPYTRCNNCRYYWTTSYNLNEYYNSLYYNSLYYYYQYYNLPNGTYAYFTSSCTVLDSPPSACYPEFCLNNGRCVTNGCPSNYSACCICPADYVGQRCESNRTFVVQSSLRMFDTFIPQLLDPSTSEYKNYTALFTNLWYNVTILAIRESFGDVDTVNLRVVLSKFKPGSVIAVMVTHGALYHRGKPIHISEMHIRKALNTHCEGAGVCSDLNFDKTHLTFNATPNVCEEASMHSCSPYATCSFHGGVNYTCTCLPGYRDDYSLFDRKGSICTESCSVNKCKNGGICHENVNSEVDCACAPGSTGRFCEVILYDSPYSLGLMAVIMLLLLIIIYLMIKLRRVQRNRERDEDKIEPMNQEFTKA